MPITSVKVSKYLAWICMFYELFTFLIKRLHEEISAYVSVSILSVPSGCPICTSGLSWMVASEMGDGLMTV